MNRITMILPAFVIAACGSRSESPAPAPAPTPTTTARTTVTQTPGGYHIQANGRTYATFTVPGLAQQPPAVTVQAARDGWQRVTMRWNPTAQVAQDQLAVRIRLSLAGDFHWVPHLSPIPGYVIAQDVFRSPAIISASGSNVVAVVPDLEFVGDLPDNPWFIDLDLPSRSIWVGMGKTVSPVDVLYQSVPGMTFSPGTVELGFYVHVFQDNGAVRNPFKVVREFLWDEFAAPRFRGSPGVPAFDQYVETAYRWLNGPWRDRVWQEFEIAGEVVGGPLNIVDATWSPNAANIVGWLPRGRPSIWNQAWFSALRAATGMYRYGERIGDARLVAMAQQVRDLTLAAPQTNGLFPSVFEADAPPPPREGGAYTPDWTQASWVNSNRVPTELGITKQWYHLVDMSWTALWLMRWYEELEPDAAILRYVRSYADRLLTLQDAAGFFPAWLDPQTQAPAQVLSDSVETAMSAWFLFEFGRLTQQPQYGLAAQRALDAVLAGPVPIGRWEDFETYWSNNSFGRFNAVGIPYLRNGSYKQNTLGMYWVAGACLSAWRETSNASYRDWGARVVDELCLWQQVWRPPFMYVPTLGGFGVMNTNTEWNDARQSLCAELFLDWSEELGDEQLWERGVAALQASFAMMYTPLNPEASTQWQARYPFLGPVDHGFTMENYGHYQTPGPNGEGMGDFAIWTWGAGAAAQSWERIRDRFGSAQFDPVRGEGRSIDPVAFRNTGGRWFVDDLADHPRTVRVLVGGQEQTLYLDGSAQLNAETGR